MGYLFFSLLGPFQVWSGEERLLGFRTIKERALLAYLVTEAGRPQRRAALAELFWPDRPEGTARNSLRQALYGLRQVLHLEDGAEDVLCVTTDEVHFNLTDRTWLDVAAFQVHLQAAEAHGAEHHEPCLDCLQHLKEAVEIYQGDFLTDIQLNDSDEFEEWREFRRQQLFRAQSQALHRLIDQQEGIGAFEPAYTYAARLAQLDPFHEPVHRRIMHLLASAGRFGAALDQFDLCRRLLKEQLNVLPEAATLQLAEQIRERSLRESAPVIRGSAHNLPVYNTPMVGRESELVQLSGCLVNAECRLLSLVGPGGVGKTRLAVQLAHLHLQAFPDGVFFFGLDAVRSSDLLAESIAGGLGLGLGQGEDLRSRLIAFLQNKRALLVMDNFEHLLEGSGLLLALLNAGPQLKILTTSREQLHYQLEHVFLVQGLHFPARLDTHRPDTRPAPRQFAAVRLLLERAGRYCPGIGDQPQDLEAAVRLCQMLEGLPLGIELAAGWTRDFTLAEITCEIERNSAFLQSSLVDLPERHRSLWASFEHSWRLLSTCEREVFAMLSVFPGSFTTQAAQAVSGGVFPWLVRLMDKSLLRRAAGGRFEMHPLLRQFAGQKLAQTPASQATAGQRLAVLFTTFIGERVSGLKGVSQVEVLNQIQAELPNVRAAWAWALAHRDLTALDQAAEGWFLFLEIRSRWEEGLTCTTLAVETLRACAETDKSRQARRLLGHCLVRNGWFACRLAHFSRSENLLLEGLALLEEMAEGSEKIMAYFALGCFYAWTGRFAEAHARLVTGLATAEQLGDRWSAAWIREFLAEVGFESGQSGYQAALFEDCLAQFEAIGERRGRGRALNYLGNIALIHARHTEARLYFEQLLLSLDEIGDLWGAANSFIKLGQVSAAQGDLTRALSLQQQGFKLLQQIGDRRRLALALRALGEVHAGLKDADQMRACFHQALQLAAEIRNLPLALDVLTGLAAAFSTDGQVERAEVVLNQVLAIPGGDPLTMQRARQVFDQLGSTAAPGGCVAAGEASAQVWACVGALLEELK